jgi:hypothetical protein
MCLFQDSVFINLRHTLSVGLLFYPSTLECKAVVSWSDACCSLRFFSDRWLPCLQTAVDISKDSRSMHLPIWSMCFAESCCSSRTMPLWSYLSCPLSHFIYMIYYDIYIFIISYPIIFYLMYFGRGDGHGMAMAWPWHGQCFSCVLCVSQPCLRLRRSAGSGQMACKNFCRSLRQKSGDTWRHLETSGDGNYGKKNANERKRMEMTATPRVWTWKT